jgi:hypothetical protein
MRLVLLCACCRLLASRHFSVSTCRKDKPVTPVVVLRACRAVVADVHTAAVRDMCEGKNLETLYGS